MKITVSGWPGAGSSTLTLLLTKTLNLNCIRGSETFRYLGKRLAFQNTGLDRVKADIYLEKYFGKVYDLFIDLVQTDQRFDNFVIESDIAAFRLGKLPNVFSIFLITDDDARRKRLQVDNRQADIEVLKHRDQENRKFYKELHGIDWFDLNEIKNKHHCVIDNSTISIAQELKKVYVALNQENFIEKPDDLIKDVENIEKEYWEKGKEYYLELFKEKNKLMLPEEIIYTIKENFPEEIKNMPQELQKALLD